MTALAEALAALDLPLDLASPLRDFVGLFHKWNQRINLSAARSEPEVDDHVIDCLHLVPHLRAADLASPRSQPASLLDVGSGGGLPAAIIAICLPALAVTALELVHKKHAFLRTAARELGLPNFEPLAQRLTDHARTDYAAATSRATFDLRAWLTLGLGHVRPSGIVFGFEAVERSDLPSAIQRFPYAHHGKSRAIVALQRPPLPDSPAPARFP